MEIKHKKHYDVYHLTILPDCKGGGFLHSYPETLRQVTSSDSVKLKLGQAGLRLRDAETLCILRSRGSGSFGDAYVETLLVATSGIYKIEYEEVTETKEGVLPKILGPVLCVHE